MVHGPMKRSKRANESGHSGRRDCASVDSLPSGPPPLSSGVIAAFAEFVYSLRCRVAVIVRGHKVLSAARLSWV